jgi:hypothetical protein
MEFDRNRYLMIGAILFMLGAQLRFVDSIVLNETSTKVFHKFAKQSQLASNDALTNVHMQITNKQSIDLPNWAGSGMLAAGVVACMHALVLPKKK